MDKITLFETADAIVSGKLGEKMRLETEPTPASLKQLLGTISEEQLQQFHLYLDNCLNPSHVLVHQLLELNLIERAIETTKELKQDKTKALELIVNYLLTHQEVDRALFFWQQLPQRSLFHRKIAQANLEKAAAFAESLSETQERDTFLREIARLLAEQERLGDALEIVKKIESPDITAYTKSNIVHILLDKHQFQKAKEIAVTIEEQDYREDAILDIVKAYLKKQNVDDAILFVERLPSMQEKNKPAKVIEGALKTAHLDEKLSRVRQLFFLPIQIKKAA